MISWFHLALVTLFNHNLIQALGPIVVEETCLALRRLDNICNKSILLGTWILYNKSRIHQVQLPRNYFGDLDDLPHIHVLQNMFLGHIPPVKKVSRLLFRILSSYYFLARDGFTKDAVILIIFCKNIVSL